MKLDLIQLLCFFIRSITNDIGAVMNAIIINTLQSTASEFAKIAKRVNISSRLRTKHSTEALELIKHILTLGSSLTNDLKAISEKNLKQRDADVSVKTEFDSLLQEVEKLSEIVNQIQNNDAIEKELIDKVKQTNIDFKNAVLEAQGNLNVIISRDNEIILIDEKIISLKENQQSYLEKLLEDTQKSLNDAEKAVMGSKSNLERGLKLVDDFKNIEIFLEEKNNKELNRLLSDVQRGWNIAVEVNGSSIPQLEFAETVYEYTEKLHKESLDIKDLVISRHKHFEESLKVFSSFTEILSVEFKKYLEIENLLTSIEEKQGNDENVQAFKQIILKISGIIKTLIEQNNDVINNSHYYTEHEAKTVDQTKEEIECFNKIIEEIEFVTETTRYPIEGSNNNITNGQILEQLLRNTLTEHDIL